MINTLVGRHYTYYNYYLLYKLKSGSAYWIIDEDINPDELIEKIENFYSIDEMYYIVEKEISRKLPLPKFKRFRKFNIYNRKCNIIYRTF